ncbi:MAG: ATP-binding protein [Deltaproteobacteria bacterium]|nr:MAG: ATP-binding protein [Deltaproteobacteria bacterium]
MKAIVQQRLADSMALNLPTLVAREARLPKIPNKAFAVIGMRRAGKTYFLFQQMDRLLTQGVDRSRLVYFNFEDERLAGMTSADLHWIPDEYYVMFPQSRSQTVHFFFDEIQLVEGWEKFVRRQLDTENAGIYVSGSSAKLLSREIASAMRGRSVETVIYPYSFREYLNCRGTDAPTAPRHAPKQMRSLYEKMLGDFLIAGGFPEAQHLSISDRRLLLQGYVNTVLYRDIVERFNLTNLNVLKALIRHMLQNPATHFTVNKFYHQLKSQGIKVAKTTLHEYLDHLRDVFLIHTVSIKTDSERRRMVNPVKVYAADTGLADAFAMSRNPDIGRLLENCIYMDLCRRGCQVSYIVTSSGFEVDFLAEHLDGRQQAIQVAADISNAETLERETRALVEAGRTVKGAELLLLNLSEESSITRDGFTIEVLPAWKWLLDYKA